MASLLLNRSIEDKLVQKYPEGENFLKSEFYDFLKAVINLNNNYLVNLKTWVEKLISC